MLRLVVFTVLAFTAFTGCGMGASEPVVSEEGRAAVAMWQREMVALRARIEGCEITGPVPRSIRGSICKVAVSVHGGDAPGHELVVILGRPEVAAEVWQPTPPAEAMMRTVLDTWRRGRGADIARVTFYFGRIHLVTAIAGPDWLQFVGGGGYGREIGPAGVVAPMHSCHVGASVPMAAPAEASGSRCRAR